MPSSRPYHDFLHPKKAGFLAAYRQGSTIKAAAENVGCDRTLVYKWLEHDEKFQLAFNIAKQDAVEAFEQEAKRRAIDGYEKPVYQGGELVGTIREYSDTLLIFLLKGMAPDKYRERQDISLTGARGLKIVVDEPLQLSEGQSGDSTTG